MQFALCTTLIGGCGTPELRDPIEGVPYSQQRSISRRTIGFRWPLSVGVGTLACDQNGAILFRSQGTTYAVSGIRTGTHDIEPLRVRDPSPPPSNPLKRLKQAERMSVFEAMIRCETAHDERCQRDTLARFSVSPEEGKQIQIEGHERRWPPLTREFMTLEPLLAAGRRLCGPGSGR